MPLYAAVEMYAAQMRVILPSISAPFGLPQPNVTVVNHTVLVPPTGVRGWAILNNLEVTAVPLWSAVVCKENLGVSPSGEWYV